MSKRKIITPYLQFLIKENIPYFLVILVLIAATFILIPYFLSTYNANLIKKQDLQSEVTKLQDKANVLNALSTQHTQDLDDDIRILQTIVPDVEDFFSIIYTLETLSRNTGFVIDSYIINTSGSTPESLNLKISGTGDNEAFLKFLGEYNFGGGRLITVREIELKSSQQGSIDLDVNFYNLSPKKTSDQATRPKSTLQNIASTIQGGGQSGKSSASPNVNYQRALERLEEIKNKVHVAIKEDQSAVSQGDESYTTKDNPF